MRLFQTAALMGAALMLASVASAQGLGDAAAREKEKKKSAGPTKVYTESDLGASAPAPTQPELPAVAPSGPGGGEAAAGGGDAKPKSDADAEKEAAERKAKEEAAWRDELAQTRKAEQAARTAIDEIQTQLNDVSTMYTPSRARALTSLEQTKQKLAELQDRIAKLEAEGRAKDYR